MVLCTHPLRLRTAERVDVAGATINARAGSNERAILRKGLLAQPPLIWETGCDERGMMWAYILAGCLKAPIVVPAPRDFAWELRPLSASPHEITYQEDGRLRITIEHELLEGVTPEMLVWWFQNFDGETEWDGVRMPTYLLWHPVDHIKVTVLDRADGAITSAGQRIHIQEAFGGDAENWLLDSVVEIARLDDSGLTLEIHAAGDRVFQLAHDFVGTDGGTLYRTQMLAGPQKWLPRQFWDVEKAFGPERARRWVKHNIEEVGSFPHFLPDLYSRRLQ